MEIKIMKKIIILISQISKSLSIKFNLIIHTVDKSTGKLVNKNIVNAFYYGNDYFVKIVPMSYITIDISNTSDKNDSYNSNLIFNMSNMVLFKFIKECKKLYNRIKESEDLYYIKNTILNINTELANKMGFNLSNMQKTKYIRMIPSLIKNIKTNLNGEDIEILPGVAFFINSYDNFCLLTLDEFELFIYTLEKINIPELTMSTLNFYYNNFMNDKKIEYNSGSFKEQKEIEYPESKVHSIPEMENNQIPNI